MLRLVHPQTGGQGTRPSSRRRAATPLTDVEQMRLRAALRNLRALYGSWACLADAMGVRRGSLENVAHGAKRVSGGMALRAAKAAGQPLERLIGEPVSADRCAHCGASKGAT